MAKKNTSRTKEPLEKQLWKAADKLRENIDAGAALELNRLNLDLADLKIT
ncbi:MAG: hypothetical protein KDC44_21475 [Phaeodactylibacter sp.]|nr:hypothetical protein [Phaeodactylibacter sp.]